ncbi:MAG: hypothetical protein ACJASM_002714 [Salibacteraceae bacterium]|jgi:hypothetical protein
MNTSTPFLFLLFLLSCNCNQESQETGETKKVDTYLDQLYSKAVADAMNPTPEEIDSALTSIYAAQDTTINGAYYVKMVSFMPENYISEYEKAKKNNKPYTIGFNPWLTVVPEIKDYFKTEQYSDEEFVEIRTKQLLGLPYQKLYSHFVELWVKPEDIKRPCPDSDPGDTDCLLDFPDEVDSKYRAWFNKNRFTTYVADEGDYAYPFTQMGYTYDWGALKNKRGLSEFVILGSIKSTEVYVNKIQTIREYLSNKQ